LNYPALAFMLNGGYYSEYDNVFGTMELPVIAPYDLGGCGGMGR